MFLSEIFLRVIAAAEAKLKSGNLKAFPHLDRARNPPKMGEALFSSSRSIGDLLSALGNGRDNRIWKKYVKILDTIYQKVKNAHILLNIINL